MITILRAHGLELAIYTHDHPPPHVHVYGGDGKAKIALTGKSGKPQLLRSSGLKANDLRRALSVVTLHRSELLQMWRKTHG